MTSMPPRILIVDHHPDDQESIRQFLTRLISPAECAGTATGAECLQHLDQNDADIVVLDHRLTDMAPGAVIDHIRDKKPDAVVVLATDVVNRETVQGLWALGANAVFFKAHPRVLLIGSQAGAHPVWADMVSREGLAIPDFTGNFRDVLSEVLDRTHDAIVCVNAEGLLTFCNPRFAELLGTEVLATVGVSFEKYVSKPDREVWRSFCNVLQTTGQEDALELQLFASSGALIPASIRGFRLRSPDGRLPGIVVVISDQGELREVQLQAAMLTQVFDHARFESILMFSKEGAVTECNRTAEYFFGKSRELLIGEDIRDLFQQSDGMLFDFDGVVRFVEASRETQANGAYNKPVSVEISVVRAIEGEDRRHLGMVFVRDLSELKSLERMKDEFLRVASHELRTPLTIITGAAGNLNDGLMGPLEKNQHQMVGRIRDNCDRLGRLINDLLDLSNLSSGKAQMRKDPANVNDVVRHAVNGMSHAIRERGVALDMDLVEEDLWVFIDSDMIARVVGNLVTNAVRFAASRIHVRVERESPASVRVSVTDDGPGLEKDDADRLFDKFVQINRVHGGAGYKGAGLGLAICKHIMESHEGRIWVESDKGRGSRFHFVLPIYDEKKQLRKFLDESIYAAAAKSVPMSLVTILAPDFATLNDLKRLLLETTFRKTDTIFLLKDPACLVLTVQEGRSRSDRIMQRINETIQELKKKKKARNIAFTLGLAVYPDEAQDPDELFLRTMGAQTVLPNRRKLWQLVRHPRG